MGFLDKARDLVGENRDKIRQGIDMAEKQARKYVPAQHNSKLAKVADMAHKGVDKVDAPAPTSAEAAGHGDKGDEATGPSGGDTGG